MDQPLAPPRTAPSHWKRRWRSPSSSRRTATSTTPKSCTGACGRSLRPGGLLVFTVEELQDAGESAGYRINTHGRYSHHHDYVTAALRKVGLQPHIARAELRMEGGEPVPGLVVRAKGADREPGP